MHLKGCYNADQCLEGSLVSSSVHEFVREGLPA
jgi:hypothetical protein